MKAQLFRYWKPRGIVTSTVPTKDGVDIMQNFQLKNFVMRATQGRPVFPVGRLDKDSNGLLLLTTDESITNSLLRPSVGVQGSVFEKEYHVETKWKVSDHSMNIMKNGVDIFIRRWSKPKEKITTMPCIIERLSGNQIKFVLREGKNRQIRKMLGSQGHIVVNLSRVRFGPIDLEGLKEGCAEQLNDVTVSNLLQLAQSKVSLT
jgi:pseudouridine synthase